MKTTKREWTNPDNLHIITEKKWKWQFKAIPQYS